MNLERNSKRVRPSKRKTEKTEKTKKQKKNRKMDRFTAIKAEPVPKEQVEEDVTSVGGFLTTTFTVILSFLVGYLLTTAGIVLLTQNLLELAM